MPLTGGRRVDGSRAVSGVICLAHARLRITEGLAS